MGLLRVCCLLLVLHLTFIQTWWNYIRQKCFRINFLNKQFYSLIYCSLPGVGASWGISDSKAQTCLGFFNITEGDPLEELSEDDSNDQVEKWLTNESLWVELLESRDSLQLKLLSALDLVVFLLFRTNELLIPVIFSKVKYINFPQFFYIQVLPKWFIFLWTLKNITSWFFWRTHLSLGL